MAGVRQTWHISMTGRSPYSLSTFTAPFTCVGNIDPPHQLRNIQQKISATQIHGQYAKQKCIGSRLIFVSLPGIDLLGVFVVFCQLISALLRRVVTPI